MTQKCFRKEYIRVNWAIDLILNSLFGLQSNIYLHFLKESFKGINFDSCNETFKSRDGDRTERKCALRLQSTHSPAVSTSLRVNLELNGLIP